MAGAFQYPVPTFHSSIPEWFRFLLVNNTLLKKMFFGKHNGFFKVWNDLCMHYPGAYSQGGQYEMDKDIRLYHGEWK